jgi:hypothetical protein
LSKAISVKKRQIKKEIILDEISDDDTSITEIKQIIKKTKTKKNNSLPESMKEFPSHYENIPIFQFK